MTTAQPMTSQGDRVSDPNRGCKWDWCVSNVSFENGSYCSVSIGATFITAEVKNKKTIIYVLSQLVRVRWENSKNAKVKLFKPLLLLYFRCVLAFANRLTPTGHRTFDLQTTFLDPSISHTAFQIIFMHLFLQPKCSWTLVCSCTKQKMLLDYHYIVRCELGAMWGHNRTPIFI